jgi:carbon storage regulator
MLVLARSAGQSVVLDERITVTVIETSGGIVRLGIAAPGDVGVRRGELDRHTDAERRARRVHPAGSRRAATPAPPAGADVGDRLGTADPRIEGGPEVSPGVVDVTEARSKSSPSA